MEDFKTSSQRMSNPVGNFVKKTRVLTSYSEIRKRYNEFEERFHSSSSILYYFNPWTGETIFDTNMVIRSNSLWALTEKVPPPHYRLYRHLDLLPETYASRTWGRRSQRRFDEDITLAAMHITAVARGFLARLKLRYYYRNLRNQSTSLEVAQNSYLSEIL